MTNEVRNALEVMVEECLKQDSCKSCPLATFCGKIPCEWDEILPQSNND